MEVRKRGFVCACLFLVLLFVNGCGPTLPPLDKALTKNLSNIDDEEMGFLLDEAYTSELNKDKYWKPLMINLLEAKKRGDVSPGIPRKHLNLFLKDCNQEQYRESYDEAVFLWYKDIFEKKTSYRVEDRAFIEAYIRGCIDYCVGGDCDCLKIGREILEKIDPKLYKAYFGKNQPFSN